MSKIILVPLHFNQYKAIQNIHKGRDVRTDIPEDEKDEYLALRNNLDIIYEYMINKYPDLYPDGTELTFEETKSIRDKHGTGKILGKRNRIITNYLGEKARVKPTQGELPKEPPKKVEPPSKEKTYEEGLKEFVEKNPSPLPRLQKGYDDDFYWYDSFLNTYNLYDDPKSPKNEYNSGEDKLLVVPAKDPFTGKYDWFMATVDTFGYGGGTSDTDRRYGRPARKVWRIREDYNDVDEIKGYLYDFETERLILKEEYLDRRFERMKKEREEMKKRDEYEAKVLKEYYEKYPVATKDDEVEALRFQMWKYNHGLLTNDYDDYGEDTIGDFKKRLSEFEVEKIEDFEDFEQKLPDDLDGWEEERLEKMGKMMTSTGEIVDKPKPPPKPVPVKEDIKVSVAGTEPVKVLTTAETRASIPSPTQDFPFLMSKWTSLGGEVVEAEDMKMYEHFIKAGYREGDQYAQTPLAIQVANKERLKQYKKERNTKDPLAKSFFYLE